jgi:small neutral amino acid transporter SnatA (MarC family)
MAAAILGGLFLVYVALTTWQMRQATRAAEPKAKLQAARKLLVVVSLGLPLLVAVILVLM